MSHERVVPVMVRESLEPMLVAQLAGELEEVFWYLEVEVFCSILFHVCPDMSCARQSLSGIPRRLVTVCLCTFIMCPVECIGDQAVHVWRLVRVTVFRRADVIVVQPFEVSQLVG